jgi:hypothetical protein
MSDMAGFRCGQGIGQFGSTLLLYCLVSFRRDCLCHRRAGQEPAVVELQVVPRPAFF